MSARRVAAAVLATGLALAGCSTTGADLPEGVTVADGVGVEVVRTDLAGPTQLVSDGAGGLLVAELAGGEDAGEGRVRRFGADGGGSGAVRASGLLTPTGVVATDAGALVVQEQTRLVRLDPSTGAAVVSLDGATVLDEGRPSNGRSHGTLTLLEDGTVLATASGSGSGPDVPAGSGELYALPADGGDAVVVATGFKNAYAHAVGPDGTLYVTEIGDGRYDGEPPLDALHAVPAATWRAALDGTGPAYDGGWPRCTGDGDPTEAFDVTAEDCAALPGPLATFPARATPTSVAVLPDGGTVLVALWVEGRVVAVDASTGEQTEVLGGVDQPQHLLTMPDGSVLLTVHASGELWRLTIG